MSFKWIGKNAEETQVIINKLDLNNLKAPAYFNPDWEATNKANIGVGCSLDLETTGLDSSGDDIIEIGLVQFLYNKTTGEILKIVKTLSQLQDPGRALNPVIIRLTGIDDDMVKGHAINWQEVDDVLSSSDIIIAHNAAFDRPFVDKKSKISQESWWGCSASQVDWRDQGYPSSKLELLNVYHGFFTGSHRALNDAEAVVWVLNNFHADKNATNLLELTENAKQVCTKVIAVGAPFESKDLLKARRYTWDTYGRNWSKIFPAEKADAEVAWLESNVYDGNFRGKVVPIPLKDNFKKR